MSATITVSAVIPAPVDQVWAIWRQPERIPEWIPSVKSVRRIGPQTEGVGAELEFTARNGFRNVTYRTRISAWEESTIIRSEIVPGSGVGTWTETLERQSTEWRFAPVEGGTQITVVQEMKLKGPVDIISKPWLLVFDRPLYLRAFRGLAKLVAREAALARSSQ